MRTVTILILAVAARAAEGEPRVFLVSGTGIYNGLYAEDEAGTHFTEVGPADIAGDHGYLWHDQGRWKLGYYTTFNKESIWVQYHAEGDQQAPPITGWKWTEDWRVAFALRTFSSEPNQV